MSTSILRSSAARTPTAAAALFVYNFSSLFGIKADFQGYAAGTGISTYLKNQYGYTGAASGNGFT